MNRIVILIIFYIVFGFIVGILDPFVIPVYLTILPFHIFLLYQSIKTNNILFIFFCAMTLLSHGIGSITFYLDRSHASSIGFNAIGNFDFSYGSLFQAYSYLALFLLTLWLFVLICNKRNHTFFVPSFMRKQYIVIRRQSSSWSIFPLLSLTLLFTAISIWMYNFHIGMIGLHQTELPFHLTGFLFYARRLLFPIILVWVFLKTKAKTTSSILLVAYSLVVGVLATSKSAALFVLLPLIYVNYMIGKKKMFFLCIIASIFVYVIVGSVRTVIYETDASVDIMSLFTTSYEFYSEDKGFLLYILNNITGRLYGLQYTVLCDQYKQLSLNDLFDFYTHSHITTIIPDYVHDLFGMELPVDKAYGVACGYIGTMQMLSCHNYLYTIIQAIIVGAVICIQNDLVQRLFKLDGRTLYKWIVFFVFLFSFLKLYEGNEFLSVYGATVLIILIYNLAQNAKKV